MCGLFTDVFTDTILLFTGRASFTASHNSRPALFGPRVGDQIMTEAADVAQLRLDNEELRATIASLRKGLSAGHAQLLRSIEEVLQIVNAPDSSGTNQSTFAGSRKDNLQLAMRAGERHVAAFLTFLSRAADVAAQVEGAATESGLSGGSPQRSSGFSWSQFCCNRWLCPCSSRDSVTLTPPRIVPGRAAVARAEAPPSTPAMTPRAVNLHSDHFTPD